MPRSSGLLGRYAQRARSRPALFVVAPACVAALVIEAGVFTGFFGLPGLLSTHGSSGPDLNPHHERILAVLSNITYIGAIQGYFSSLEGTNLCGVACPELPREWPSDGILPAEVGVYFYFNVSNDASVDVNLSVPVISTSGPTPTLFFLQTFCCYTTANPPYVDLLDAQVPFTPHQSFGLEGYAYTTVPLPAVAGGGYTLYVNYTSN